MAKKKANQGRRVVSPLADSSQDYTGPSSADMKSELDFYGRKRAQLVDISTEMESIFTLQQNQRREIDQMYGIEKKMLDNLGFMANQVKIVALQKQASRDLSLEESNILKTTISDYETYNQEAAAVAKKSKELLDFRKKTVPFEDKIRGIQAEISAMQVTGIKNLNSQEKERLKGLQTMEKGYQALSKQEQMNQRIEKIQGSITDLMENQGGAASQIYSTLKDIVTNPLTLFTGLLAVGLSRFETMRQRGNELAEEMDRVNKKLAGAGPFQDKILQKADLIKKRFYEMGEGFSSSLEGSVDAIVALENQFGKIDYVSGKLVKTMAELKLSIGLSDEESAKVLDNFSIVGGMTDEAAVNMTKMTYQMSEQAGLNPQVIFQDIASASGDTLASFSGSADELAKSAVTARRLGLTLDDMTKVSSALLDFETSIEKEMEAQLITGLDLNFQKARMLAMQGDEAGAMEEVMKQVGGLDKFNKMAPYQQRALAEAVGLTVGQLQKSTAQRQREAQQAQMKQDLVKKQYDLAEKALPMLGKLDVGLGVMERIAKVIGDLFLDVFGTGLKDLEKTFFKFLESPAFKTGFKNLLYTIKGIIIGIKDAVMGTAAFIDKLSGGAIGGFLKSFASKDFSGSYGKAEGVGKSIGKGIAVLLGAKMLLGATPFTPMYVTMGGGIMGKLSSLFTGGGGGAGKFYKGGQFMPGGGRAPAGGMMSGAGGGGGGMAAALPYVAAAAFVAKGIYDVASLDELSGEAGGTTRAKAQGGMSGAGLGAAIGTMILPGIGTAIGAGIGYFGGRMVGSMDMFKNKLDKANDKFIKAEKQLQTAKTEQTLRNMRLEIEASDKVHDAYGALANDIDGFTKNDMKTFAKSMLDAGNITKKDYTDAINGSIGSIDLLNIAAGGAASQMGVVGMLQDQYVQENLDAKNAQTKVNIGRSEKFLEEYLNKVTEDYILEKIKAKDVGLFEASETKEGFTGTTMSTSIGYNDKQMDILVGMMDKIVGEKVYSDKQIRDALFDVRGNMHIFSSAEGQAEDLITMAIGQLKTDIKTEIKDGNSQIISAEKQLLDEAQKIITIDAVMGSDSKGGKGLKVLLDEIKSPVSVQKEMAQGGITYGPSHANGGIPTRYGELEGGEAVINKRSTAMFKGQLSQINQAGGGVKFADGGLVDAMNDPDAVNYSHAVNGLWTRSIPAYHMRMSDFPYDITPGRSGTYSKKSGYQQTPMALDVYDKYVGLFGRPSLHSDNGRYMGYNSHSQRKYHDTSHIDKNVILKDKAKHEKRNAKNRADYTPNMFQNMSESTSKYDMYNPMRLATSPVAESVANAQQVGAEWTAAILGSLMGGSALGSGGAAWMGRMIPQAAKGAYNLMYAGGKSAVSAMGTGGTQMLTGPTFLSKLMGGVKAYGGASSLFHGIKGIKKLVTGKGSMKDISNVFLGGPKAKWLKGMYETGIKIEQGKYFDAAMALAPPALKGIGGEDAYYAAKGGKSMYDDLKSWFTGGSDEAELAKEAGLSKKMLGSLNPEGGYGFDIQVGRPTAEFMPDSPIKQVNDMILTKDGQMIETHEDDNLIAKKGGITQKPSGGKSRVEELLEQLIMVTREGGDVYMDGAKVSAAVNQANYNA